MKWSILALVLVVLTAVPLGLTGIAQDGELSGLLDDETSMVLRVHNVADLTVRLMDFKRSHLAIQPAGSEMNEDEPCFGAAYEGERFFADIEEIAELIEMNVRPEVWALDGPAMRIVGSHALVVSAPAEIQKEVAAYLASLRASVGRLVTVELRLYSLTGPSDGTALWTRERLAKLEAAGAELALSSRITGFSGQRISFYRALQRSYVQDYDVEVAQTALIADPIVTVQQLGLSFDVRCVNRGDSHVVVDLGGYLTAAHDEDRTVSVTGGPVTAPAQRLVEFRTTVAVPVGTHALVSRGKTPDGRNWALFVAPHLDRIGVKGGAK